MVGHWGFFCLTQVLLGPTACCGCHGIAFVFAYIAVSLNLTKDADLGTYNKGVHSLVPILSNLEQVNLGWG